MAQVITLAGERLFALKAQNNQQLDIDTFIFAYVPGQDSTAPIDRNEGLPPIEQRVCPPKPVQQYGMIEENAVVYSSVLDSLTGPFQFNWVGLYSSVNQTLVAIQHIPTVVKTVTEPGASGNILNRNFVIEYSGIAELTGITVAPETWQLDYTARLNGMDELTRQLAADMNGKDWFIDDGFKVEPRSTLNTFKVTAGAGYVSGLRVELATDHILTLSSYPQFVYVDAWFDGTSESVWKGQTAFTVTNTEMDDYIDVNGRNHYVFKLARITAADAVEDLRNIDGLAQKIDKQKKEIAIIMPDLDFTGEKDESLKILELLQLGYGVKLPPGKIKLNITLPDGSVLLGSGAPRFDDTISGEWDDFGTVILGDINVSDKISWTIGNLSIDNYDAGGNTIAGIGARTGFGYVKNVKTRANNHGHLYETACANPLAGYDATSGVVGNIVVEDAEHWGGPNGFVSKHHRVKFIRCKSWGVEVQGFVAASDNINEATTYNRATETLFEVCYSEGVGVGVGGSEGIRIYTQDRFSADPVNDVNTNNVQPVDATYIVNYKSQLMGGSSIRVGDTPNPSVCELASTNTFIDGWKYAPFAFSGITLHHSYRTIISRSEFGAGANVSVQPQASGVIIDDTNIMLGGNIQTGAEVGRILVNNNSNSIENRFWTQGLTYRFQNTSPTTINSVIFSIYNKPIRLVIEDVFTEIGLFSGGVNYKGKGTVIEAMFNGSEWIVLNNGTIKSINEQSIAYAASINFDYLNANSNNLSVLLGGDLTTISATIEGMPYGSTVGLFIENGAVTKNLSGWGLMWRFEGSVDVNQLGNAPTSIAPYTKMYIEFYVRNGLLIEKSRSFYV